MMLLKWYPFILFFPISFRSINQLTTLVMISTFILSATAAIACLTASSNAFSPSVGRAVVNKNNNSIRKPLFAEAPDGPKDGTTITSARKEIGYDAASARVSCSLYGPFCFNDRFRYLIAFWC